MLTLFIGTLHSSSEPIRYVMNHFRDRRGAEIAPKSPLLGCFSNDNGDGNGNENAKKAMGLLSKATVLHVHHICGFCTFLCRHCTTTT